MVATKSAEPDKTNIGSQFRETQSEDWVRSGLREFETWQSAGSFRVLQYAEGSIRCLCGFPTENSEEVSFLFLQLSRE